MTLKPLDGVFYLSVVGLAWNNIQNSIHELVNHNIFSWLNIVFIVIATFAFAFYEKLNGTPIVPTPPTPSSLPPTFTN